MKFSELKTGMVVVTHNGDDYLVVRDCETTRYGWNEICLINKNKFLCGSEFHEDMTHNNPSYNIDKVYGEGYVTHSTYELDKSKLVWQRVPGVRKMTLEEISAALGYKVELIEGKE